MIAKLEATVAGLAGDAPRRASALAAAVVSLLLVARVSSALTSAGGAQVPFIVALFALPLLYAFGGTRLLLNRYRWQMLTVQAVLTWVPFAVFGGGWGVGVGGLLAGLVLLTLPGRLSWPLAGALLTTEVLVRVTLTGLPSVSPAWFAVLYVVTYYVDDGLMFFGLVRLAQTVGELQQARGRFAQLAVAGERLQAAEELQAAVGDRLADIATSATAARQALLHHPAQASTHIAAAGATAREAVAQTRALMAGFRDPNRPEPADSPAEASIGTRLAWAVLLVVLCAFTAENIGYIAISGYGTRLTTLATIDVLLTVALQLHHSRSAHEGARPRAWQLTLAAQALLVYAFLFPSIAAYVGGLGGFLAGSILLLIADWWRWAGFAAVVASWSALYVTLPLRGLDTASEQNAASGLEYAAIAASVGLLVYGLSQLIGMARQMQALRGELTRMAVIKERLQVARDVHDLLGLGLSAVALKADLIGRLIGRDDARAASELGQMSRICAAARADIRLVTGERHQPSLSTELASAQEILASVGIEVHAEVRCGPPPPAADHVLTPVLREAVTNVLRHSTAATCTIEASIAAGALRLRVSNDGVTRQRGTGDDESRPGGVAGTGNGLANLTARVHASGGHLTSRQISGRFDLIAEIPLPDPSAAPQAAEGRAPTTSPPP